ncbi:hypothetical protein [Nocardioides sp. P5_E3]
MLIAALVAGGLPYAFASALHARGLSSSLASVGVVMTGSMGLVGAVAILVWALVTNAPEAWIAAFCLPAASVFALYLEYERQGGAGRAYNLSRVVPAVLTLTGCALLLALDVRDVGWYLAAMIVPTTAMTLKLYWSRIGLFRAGRLKISGRVPPDVSGQALKAWPSAITDSLLLRLDQVMLAVLLAPQALGKYAVAVLLAESVGIIRHGLCAARFRSLTVPVGEELSRSVRAFLTQLSVIALPCYAAVGLFAQFAVVPLLGPSYKGVAAVAWVLLAAQIALDWHLALGTVLLAQQKPAAFSRSSVTALAIHVLAFFALTPTFGVIGAAIATLVGYLTAASMTGVATKRLSRKAMV